MTQKEIKDKIADWENRLKNPSVAGVPSAVTKINSEIAKLEAMLEKDEKPKAEKKEKVAKETIFKVGDVVVLQGGDALLKKITSIKENKKGEIIYSGYYENKPSEKFSMDGTELVIFKRPKKEKAEHEKHEAKETKAEPKKDAYDCDDLVKEAKERHAKAKKAAQARANAPKKSEATKDKEKIEKVHETVEKQLEKGKLNKSQLQKLIAETKDLLKLLEKALKDL